MNPLWHPSFPWWQFVIRGSVIYLAVLVLIRISGKRQVAQMGIHELVALLLISNAVQNAMNGGDNSITGGLILACVLIGITLLLAVLTYRSRQIENLVQGRPTLLVHHGKVLRQNLAKELLSFRELLAMLRRQGVHDIHEIDQAILEPDGYISIVRKNEVDRMKEYEASEAS